MRIQRVITIGAMLALSSCVHIMNPECKPGLFLDSCRLETASDSYLFAQMSANAYGKNEFVLPARYRVEAQGNDDIDFAYNAYFDGAQPSRIIVAYRGTDSKRDIGTGSLSVRQIDRGLAVFDELRQKFPQADFVVTGHSLGGAIALSVSHCRADVTAYVFNTSSLYRKCREFEDGNDSRRFSIVEYGEALKAMRFVTKKTSQTYTPFNCRRGVRLIGDHAIRQLAECLTQYAATANGDARLSLNANQLPFKYNGSADSNPNRPNN